MCNENAKAFSYIKTLAIFASFTTQLLSLILLWNLLLDSWLALKVWIAAIKYSRIYTFLYSRYICVIVSTFLILTFVDSAYLALGIIARGPDFDASLGPTLYIQENAWSEKRKS